MVSRDTLSVFGRVRGVIFYVESKDYSVSVTTQFSSIRIRLTRAGRVGRLGAQTF